MHKGKEGAMVFNELRIVWELKKDHGIPDVDKSKICIFLN